MAFLDKLAGIAKNIGNKAGEVVETTKLSVKISGEKDSILENQRKIGEYFYNKLHETEVDAEAKPFFDAITTSFANIAAYEKEIEEQKAESGSIFKTEEPTPPNSDAQPAASETADQPVVAPAEEEAPQQPEEEPAQPEAEQNPEEQAPPSEDE